MMSALTLVKLSYFVAATLFLLGLQRMASPRTARSGIQWAGVGMLIATIATFFLPGLHNAGCSSCCPSTRSPPWWPDWSVRIWPIRQW